MSVDDENFSIERHVGRVVEARVFALDDVDVADRYSVALADLVRSLPGGTIGILCADHRFAEIYPQPVTDRLLELFRRMNTRLERVAILVHPRQATFYMQLSRIVRAAAYEARRVFRETPEALDYLRPILTPPEAARTQAFLASGRDPSRQRGL